MAVVMGVGVVMAPAMATVAIPATVAGAVLAMVVLAMAAIQAPMVLLFMHPRRLRPLFMHPRRLRPYNQPHWPMAPAMATVTIPDKVATAVALPALPMVVLAMAVAIQAPMVRRMVTLPRRLHPHNRQHLLLPSNLTRIPDEPAQGCVSPSLLNELTYLHQQAIKVRFENAFPDYLFNDDFLFTSGFVNADGSSVRGLAYAE
jgi:hypothetical protein